MADETTQIIFQIVNRASDVYKEFGYPAPDRLHLAATLTDVHAKHPLRLDELLAARLLDFTHDIGGILRYWDIVNHEFRDCFMPRYCLMRAFA